MKKILLKKGRLEKKHTLDQFMNGGNHPNVMFVAIYHQFIKKKKHLIVIIVELYLHVGKFS